MATRTISNAGGNWSSTGSWVEGAVAIAGDAVVATATSGNLVVNVASACASIVLTNYAGTLTFDANLTTTSTVTFVSGMSIAGTAGILLCGGTVTLTSGGKTMTGGLYLTTNTTFTMGDNWTVNGQVQIGVSGSGQTINGNQITCAGGLRRVSSTGNAGGTTNFKLTGGTWDDLGSTGLITSNIEFAGNVTVSGAVRWGGATSKQIKYTSGTVTTTGSTLNVSIPVTPTFDTAGMTWNDVTLSSAATYTLSSTLAWSGTLTLSAANTFTGAGTLAGPGGVTPAAATTQTLNNTGGITTVGTLTLPNGAITFAGSAGFTVGTLTTATLSASRIYTLTFGNTYTVTTALSNAGTTAAIRQAVVSASPGNKVVLTLSPGGTSDLFYCDPTDIDSSGGRQIFTSRGTVTTSLNWVATMPLGGGGARNLFIGGVP